MQQANYLPCDTCGASFPPENLQRIEIDLRGEFICPTCAKRALLIAGQVELPGWIAEVWQPRNVDVLASQHFRLMLSREEVHQLVDDYREACQCRLREAFLDYWKDEAIPDHLKHVQVIDTGHLEKYA